MRQEDNIIRETYLALKRFPESSTDHIHLSIKVEGDEFRVFYYQFPKDFEMQNRREAASIIARKAIKYEIPVTTNLDE
jgi:hypothetical protein